MSVAAGNAGKNIFSKAVGWMKANKGKTALIGAGTAGVGYLGYKGLSSSGTQPQQGPQQDTFQPSSYF